MAHSPNIPPINVCIAYIEACGWKLRTRQHRWYRFDKTDAQRSTNEVSFTLNQIRDAYLNGW